VLFSNAKYCAMDMLKCRKGSHIAVKVPMIGLETFAKDERDVPVAISEAVVAFCIAAEKFGRGIEVELAEAIENEL